MRIVIIDSSPSFASAARAAFAGLQGEGVEVFEGRLEEFSEEFDCVVSPCNTVGILAGNFEQTLVKLYGGEWHAEAAARIQREHDGETTVGDAFVVERDGNGPRCVVYCAAFPRHRNSARDATRGALSAVYEYNQGMGGGERGRGDGEGTHAPIQTVLMPGLGTFLGCPDEEAVVRDMASVAKEFMEGPGKTK
uniref:Macro domain-containing protein n=1 Tax=Chromera velia CCMP2878 TaxID=1169474 RepID=A0A0G4HKL4_9ALVE|eukprot:Cvel_7232.t1-p1 / transcript=Cvel_7232.t1 / gene=Cvel_7232 / organism=Chromera_velia_CCMP2878 / gene_product=hypothetical protein / transcript_product=hypothetical protein / location=Cvel_scaffold373:22870-23445(-) / protein_length=192 / sequence_SO=supercontig / SO=protein_coding / is_pseudo=false